MLTSSAIILTVNFRSYRISSLTRAVFHLSMLLMVIRCAAHLQQGFCLQKTFCASEKACALDIASSPKAFWSNACVVVAMSPSLTQKRHTAARYSVFPVSWRVRKQLLTCQAPTLHWDNVQPCHWKWGLRKDQGQRPSKLAECSIASTARTK